jgi:hypothetical protein
MYISNIGSIKAKNLIVHNALDAFGIKRKSYIINHP